MSPWRRRVVGPAVGEQIAESHASLAADPCRWNVPTIEQRRQPGSRYAEQLRRQFRSDWKSGRRNRDVATLGNVVEKIEQQRHEVGW